MDLQTRISTLRSKKMSVRAITESLNKDKIPTPTGKIWTQDNLRKQMERWKDNSITPKRKYTRKSLTPFIQ